jgi:transposase
MRASDNGSRPSARYGQNDGAIAIGRKSYLFAGSDAGGRRAAPIYSLIESAKLNGRNPQHYLADVLARIADHPARRIAELLPWNWQPLNATRAAA